MIKYNLQLNTSNVFDYPYNKKELLTNPSSLKSVLSDFNAILKFKGMNHLSNNFVKKINIDDFIKKQNKKYKEEVSYYSKNIQVEVKLLEYSENYQDSNFVEIFHTSLRKYCESSQAWGLWQWISYSFDKKELTSLSDGFWRMMYASFEEVKSKKINLKKDLKETSQIIKNNFVININEWRNSNNNQLKEDLIRQQYYIMIALFEGFVSTGEFESICYSVLSD